MNLDDLKNRWMEQERKVDRITQLNLAAVRELRLSSTKSSLHWMTWGVGLNLAVVSCAVIWLGDFIAGHIGEPHFLVAALLIDACAIAWIGSTVRQLLVIRGLDYSGPVVAVQKELEKLRIARIRSAKWTFIAGCMLWAPFLIVLLRGTIGLDAYSLPALIGSRNEHFLAWILMNILLGIGLALLVMWGSRRYVHCFEDSPFLKRLMDDLAGRSLTRALRSLESIDQFELESGSMENHSA